MASCHLSTWIVWFILSSFFLFYSPLSLFAQAADPPTQRIGPGGMGSIHHGVKSKAAAQPSRLLSQALTLDTRKRLQQAMDANPVATPAH